MFSHVMIGTNDLEVSKKFYDAVLGTLTVKSGRELCLDDVRYWKQNRVIAYRYVILLPL